MRCAPRCDGERGCGVGTRRTLLARLIEGLRCRRNLMVDDLSTRTRQPHGLRA
jgi:hypothetical protein